MKFSRITFMVRDMEKTISFYQNLAELKIIKRFSVDMGEIAFLADTEEDTMLEFIHFDAAEKVDITGMVMSFKVNGSLEDLREKAITLGYYPSEIVEKQPKPAHFLIADSDGTLVEFSV